MRIRVLGPLELVHEDRSVHIGGPRQQVTLAVLAVRAGRVAPVDVLAKAVWGDEPPATARSQIQICVSALRRVLAKAGRSEAIVTKAGGYLLDLAPDELDLLRFTELTTTAREHEERRRPAAAAAALGAALALWGGSALLGVDSELVRREAVLLDEQRLRAVEDRLRLLIALGRHDEVIGELFDLVDRHPWRERLHESLMLALYRAGRQADALDRYRRVRTAFADELGVEPSARLRDLERAMLNRQPALDVVVPDAEPDGQATPPPASVPVASPPAVVPRELPAALPDFTGREAELTTIRAAVEAEDGAVRVVAITGKGGVGKTALAVRAAHLLAESFPDGQLYTTVDGDSWAEGVAATQARFLRSFGVPGASVPGDPDERAALYRSTLADKRVLLVLDEVVDERVVTALLPGAARCAVIATSRRRLSGIPGAVPVPLEVFDADLSLELLGRIAGSDRVLGELSDALELAALCGGLPLALRIAGARLAGRAHWRLSSLVRRLRDEERRLDEFAHGGVELRPTLALAYRSLDEQAQRLLRRLAGLRAPDFAAWTAALLLDTDPAAAEDVLESLVNAHLVDVVTPSSRHVRYRFHDLVRVYARELAAADPPRAHADALRAALGGWLTLTRVAHRHEYGGEYTLLTGATPEQPVPGDAVDDVVADPGGWWEAERRALCCAVHQAAELGHHELCWELALTAVTLFESKGYFDDWRETGLTALRATEAAGNRKGFAAARYSLGTLHMFQKRLTEATRLFQPAASILAAEGDDYGHALVLRNMAFIDGLRGDRAARAAKYESALRGLRAAGDEVGEAHVLYNMAGACLDDGEHARAKEMLGRALEISRRTRCVRVEAQATFRLGEAHHHTGDLAAAEEALAGALRLVRATDDRIGEAHALAGLAAVQRDGGRREQATTTFVEAVTTARQVGERLVEGRALHGLSEIALADGAHTSAVEHLRAALELFEAQGAVLWQARALLALERAHAVAGEADQSRMCAVVAGSLLDGLDPAEAERLRAEFRADERRWGQVG
ncbi:AfsR/SARP family transcriptional regulator [Actinokineospora sp. G85]|uniref:AfsR/SARP family transcriptional regulator n=1 Tax=Actinokineospora sp. G85 TaxID=3406626 RepID=UPI003C72B184